MNRSTPMQLALASVLASMVSGCFLLPEPPWSREPSPYVYDDPYTGPRSNTVPTPYNDGTLEVVSSNQIGNMGEVSGYTADAVASNASYYGTGASLRLDSIGDNYWVMSYLSIGNLDIINAEPGTYRATSAVYDGTEPQLSVIGCSGPTYGNYTFDAGSRETEITISDNEDGSRNLEFRAIFDFGSATQEARGTVVYRPGTVAQPQTERPFAAIDASQDGSMGEIRAFSGQATGSSGTYLGTSAWIRLDSVGTDWWVMSNIDVANLDLQTAPAGTYRSTSATYDPDAPAIHVTGCSGPSYGNYTFDAGSDEAEMTIADNADGSRTVEVTALFSWGGASQQSTARFTYLIDGTAGTTAPNTLD